MKGMFPHPFASTPRRSGEAATISDGVFVEKYSFLPLSVKELGAVDYVTIALQYFSSDYPRHLSKLNDAEKLNPTFSDENAVRITVENQLE